jgi:hypothetical protein
MKTRVIQDETDPARPADASPSEDVAASDERPESSPRGEGSTTPSQPNTNGSDQ